MTAEYARLLVLNYTAAMAGKDEALIEKVVARMVNNGECVWHALAMVSGRACPCHSCAREAHA